MLLLNTCVASLFRGLLSGFPFTATSALAGRFVILILFCVFKTRADGNSAVNNGAVKLVNQGTENQNTSMRM
jgi:type III secretory pathway component EscV